MPRPPKANANDPMRAFKVAPHHSIGDNNNVRRNGGDEIMLTHPQAVYFQKLGAIEVEIPDFSNESQAATDPAPDTEEAGAEPEADGGGDNDVGDTSAKPPAKAKRSIL